MGEKNNIKRCGIHKIEIFERAAHRSARELCSSLKGSVQFETEESPEKRNVVDTVSEIFYYQKIFAST